MPKGVYKNKSQQEVHKGKHGYLSFLPRPLKPNAGKRAMHIWVIKWKGQPDTCEMCGLNGLSGLQINWANIDHQYRRVLEDYIRLCSKCHGKYDTEHGLRKRKGIYLTQEELSRKIEESKILSPIQLVSDNQK